jgi:hypothetical protein
MKVHTVRCAHEGCGQNLIYVFGTWDIGEWTLVGEAALCPDHQGDQIVVDRLAELEAEVEALRTWNALLLADIAGAFEQ